MEGTTVASPDRKLSKTSTNLQVSLSAFIESLYFLKRIRVAG